MIRPTPCQRCGGSVIPERDEWGQREDVCLACGAREYPDRKEPTTIDDEKAALKNACIGRGERPGFARHWKNRKLDDAARMRLMEA